ncbi:MAG TPA: sigma-70 family RNA polymerase sigma factor [Polyangiales bacterium]|nr:sigma-70 family RNA polymerase sigma factor [Polyangiales bacterium]
MRSTAFLTPSQNPGAWPADRSVPMTLQVQQVYEAHFDFVWRTARRLGAHESQLDDVVQEVFLVVQRRLASFEGRSELKTWLFGITRKVVYSTLRRSGNRREVALGEDEELPDVSAPTAEMQLAADEDTRLLYALLRELDEDKRAVFVLSELEEMSGPEIAEALDLQLSNVYARVRAARQAFDAALRRYRAREARSP